MASRAARHTYRCRRLACVRPPRDRGTSMSQRFLTALLMLMASALAAPAIGHANSRLDQVVADVHEARELARSIPDQALRERMELLLSRAELSAHELQRPAVAAPPAAMSQGDLQTFLATLSRQSFDDGKLRVVKTLAPSARLTSEQAKQILAKFSFAKGRVEAAVLLHALIVDPHLFAVTLEALPFDSERRDVLKRIGIR